MTEFTQERVAVTGSALDDVKIAAAIDVLGLGVDPAEFHGGICGLLCASGPGAVAVWMRHSGGDGVGEPADANAAREQLHEAEAETWRLLSEPAFEFQPLLPAGDTELAERVPALALWCHGFVAGLGLGGLGAEDLESEGDDGDESAKLAEIVADLIEISRAGLDSEGLEDADGADFDLAELLEYVRAAVQIVFDELQTREAPRNAGVGLH